MLNDPSILQSNSNSPTLRPKFRPSPTRIMEAIDLRPHAARRDQIVRYNLCSKHEAFVTPVSSGYIGVGKGPREVHFALTTASFTTINCLLERPNSHLPRFPSPSCAKVSTVVAIAPLHLPPSYPSMMTTPPSPPLRSKFTSKLHNASILILGGTSGIGYAVAEACIEFRCAHLTISGSRQPKIDATIACFRATYPSSTYPT
jgi:hypothetical protein